MSGKPTPDTSHIETRLLVVAEMLERAVAEVHRAMSEIRTGTTEAPALELLPPLPPLPATQPSPEKRNPDVQ